MKTTPTSFKKMQDARSKQETNHKKQEPGRFVGAKYVPNRIFRGKIVEALRDAPAGLSVDDIGQNACIDWQKNLEPWLKKLINKLVQEEMIAKKGKRYVLRS